MDKAEIDNLARIIWDYHHMNHVLKKADCILVMGSYDTRVAEHGARLFLKGWAPVIVFSGGLGRHTKGAWKKSEAETFADIALRLGVPRDKILIENRSTNTGENILFTRKLLTENHLEVSKMMAVHKPYMERRAYATFKKQWPEVAVIVTSPPISFDDYPYEHHSKEELIHIMVGDLQRIKLYAERSFQIPQEIPAEVWAAYEQLVALGYTKD